MGGFTRAFLVLLIIGLSTRAVFGGNNSQIETTPTYSGQAAVLHATVLGAPLINISDTGPLPAAGGALEKSVLDMTVPLLTLGNISLGLLHATTVGQVDAVRSEASVANVRLNLPGLQLGAGLLMARANATCQNASGVSTVVGLTINDQSVVVTGAPNQAVNLAVGQVIINEQVVGPNSITVNALRVIVNGLADIVIASAKSGIVCQGQPPCAQGDFVTGGGQITLSSNKKANFAIAGGIKNGFWGHLNFIDHGTGMKVHGKNITEYVKVNNTTRKIVGQAEVDGNAAVGFTVIVEDKGEPGTSDSFSLQLTNGYNTGKKTLTHGNIQLHKSSCRLEDED